MSFRNKHSLKQKELFQEKFEIVDEKYKKMKEILKQVLQDLKYEREKNDILQKEYSKLSLEVKEKEDLLERMQSVSEAVVDEFSTLKVKCDMETEAAANAIKRATMYFQENQKLKKNPQCDLQESSENSDTIISDHDSVYETVPELEILNKLNSDLRTEVATLTTQLGKESEKHELLMKDLDIVRNLYKQEMEERKSIEEKLKSLELLYDSLTHSQCSKEKSESSNGENTLKVNDFSEKIDLNCDSLDSKSSVEDLKEALAETEKQKNALQIKVKELEKQILDVRLNGAPAESLFIPPPPPPPPPAFNPIKSFITFINAGKKQPSRKATTPVKDGYENERHKAMSEMMNAIKSGNIQLKPVQKTVREKETTNAEPVALMEMKNILETLKKRERPHADTDSENTKNDLTKDINIESFKNTDSNLINNQRNGNDEILHKSDFTLQETTFNSGPNSLEESPECLSENFDRRSSSRASSIRLSINDNWNGSELKYGDIMNDSDLIVEEDPEKSFVI